LSNLILFAVVLTCLCSFVPPPSSVSSEADKDLSDLLDFSAVSHLYFYSVVQALFCFVTIQTTVGLGPGEIRRRPCHI